MGAKELDSAQIDIGYKSAFIVDPHDTLRIFFIKLVISSIMTLLIERQRLTKFFFFYLLIPLCDKSHVPKLIYFLKRLSRVTFSSLILTSCSIFL